MHCSSSAKLRLFSYVKVNKKTLASSETVVDCFFQRIVEEKTVNYIIDSVNWINN